MDTKEQRQRQPRPAQNRNTSKAADKGRRRTGTPKNARSEADRKKPAENRDRREKPERKQSAPIPNVVYTPAKPLNRNRIILRLATVVAVVLALVFGISIFFKVENITVSGTQKYSAWTVKEASGIEVGDNLLTFGKAQAYGKIIANLPYVESVHIGIKLPDTVNIVIKELDVVYAVKDSNDSWWLMTSDGRLVEQVDSAGAGNCTQIQGFVLDAPAVGEQASAWEQPADPTAPTPAAPVTVRAADRLNTALDILQYLEDCGIIGQVVSVNVADLGNVELWYGQQYQVKLGDTTQLRYKIQCMNEAINGDSGLRDYDSGVLDISFTVKKDQIVYDPMD